MSEQEIDLSGDPIAGAPQCNCKCHNYELGNTLADVDWEGHHAPATKIEMRYWATRPRFVDRRSLIDAAVACPACIPAHTLALSSSPGQHVELEQVTTPERAQLGGPQGRCQPDCGFCRRHDSIREDHK